jgi:hypothetical protein
MFAVQQRRIEAADFQTKKDRPFLDINLSMAKGHCFGLIERCDRIEFSAFLTADVPRSARNKYLEYVLC